MSLSVPLPDVGLSSAPTAPQHLDAPGTAFGANVLGDAADKLGTTADQAGQMLEQHAQVMQGLNNKAEADNLSTQFLKASADAHDQYTTTQLGSNAQPALADAMKGIETARVNLRNQISNPLAQQMFDQDTRRQQAVVENSMANHAATQQQKYWKDSSSAKMATAVNFASSNFNDPDARANALDGIAADAKTQGSLEGWSPEQVQLYQTQNTSKLWTDTLKNMAVKDGPGAQALFQTTAIKQMTGSDQAEMGKYLENVAAPQRADNYTDGLIHGIQAHNLTATGQAFNASAQDRDALARVIATEAGGEQPLGQIAVGQVLLNRVRNGDYSSLYAAAHAPNQFEGMTGPNANMATTDPRYVNALKIADSVLAGQVGDPTGGATKFLNPTLQAQLGRAQPAWADGSGQRIGNQVFYGQTKGQAVDLSSLDAVDAAMPRLQQAVMNDFPPGPDRDATLRSLDSKLSAIRTGLVGQQNMARGALVDALTPNPDNPSAPVPTTLAQLLSNKDTASQYALLDQKDQAGIKEMLIRNANPTTRLETPEARANYQYLYGEKTADPVLFANRNLLTDPLTQGLPANTLQSLMKEQTRVRQGVPAPEAVRTAMSLGAPMINAAFPQTGDKADKTKFTAAFTQAAEAYANVNHKPPDEAWVNAKIPFLLQNRNFDTPGHSGLIDGVPNDAAQTILTEAHNRGIYGVTDAQVQAVYSHMRKTGG